LLKEDAKFFPFQGHCETARWCWLSRDEIVLPSLKSLFSSIHLPDKMNNTTLSF